MTARRRLPPAIVAGVLASAAIGAAPASAATNVAYGTVPGQFNVMTIAGEADVDQIGMTLNGGTVTITDQGPGGITTVAPACTAVNPATVTCPSSFAGVPLTQYIAILDADDDTFVNSNVGILASIVPGDGADYVESGPGDEFIDDSLGNDTYNGGPGDDFLDGTSGNTDTGADLLDGGPGHDEVDYSGLPAGVQVTLGDQQANDGLAGEGDNAMRIENAFGTDFADSLRGDGASNQLESFGGNDVLVGLAGNDVLSGGEGDDSLNGGASPDGSPDRLDCGLGTDVALAQPEDLVLPNCERRGAVASGEGARAGRDSAKLSLECPATEGGPCAVTLRMLWNNHRFSKPKKLTVLTNSGKTVRVKLTRFGRAKLARSGGRLFVSALVDTAEPGGVATTEAQILVQRVESRSPNKR